MTSPAKFPAEDFFHCDGISTRLHFKNSRVTIPAIKPDRVRIMRIHDIRRVAPDLEDDIKVNRRHGAVVRVKGFLGVDVVFGDGLNPIHIT